MSAPTLTNGSSEALGPDEPAPNLSPEGEEVFCFSWKRCIRFNRVCEAAEDEEEVADEEEEEEGLDVEDEQVLSTLRRRLGWSTGPSQTPTPLPTRTLLTTVRNIVAVATG